MSNPSTSKTQNTSNTEQEDLSVIGAEKATTLGGKANQYTYNNNLPPETIEILQGAKELSSEVVGNIADTANKSSENTAKSISALVETLKTKQTQGLKEVLNPTLILFAIIAIGYFFVKYKRG